MSQIKFEKEMKKLIKNRHLIPDEFWIPTDGRQYEVIWFMDRQKPSVEACYDFDEERLGLTKDGKIIWGWDSGCSCPSPWSQIDFGDDNYYVKEWKEFQIEAFGEMEKPEPENSWDMSWFDKGWEDECYDNLNDFLLLIKKNLKGKEVLNVKNAEVRRYLIKRIGYENIKDDVDAESLHVDGHNELLKFNTGEMYVKVRDHSTDREYLLYVEGNHQTCRSAIAWTFGLSEADYQPEMET